MTKNPLNVSLFMGALTIAACQSGGADPSPARDVPTEQTGGAEAGMANGAEVVSPEAARYLALFRAPRDPIRLTQVAVRPGRTIIGIVETDAVGPLRWQLVTAENEVLARGESEPQGLDKSSGSAVHRIEAGANAQRDRGIRLVVEGIGQSHPFDIADDAYTSLKYDALNYFYQNRTAEPILAQFAGGQEWDRPAGHPTEVLSCFAGTDLNGVEWPGCDYTLDVAGGWYDAGDHSKYVVNSAVSVWTLQHAYETGARGFEDGRVAIPEAGNGMNDLLDEARENLDYMMSMQAPEGARAPVALGDYSDDPSKIVPVVIDVSGMAHHKSGDVRWAGFPMLPSDNDIPRVLHAPSVTATLGLAATTAQCARIYREIDTAYADECLTAARRAYRAAKRTPDAYSYNNFTGTGPYDSVDPRGEFYWAAVELALTTGEQRYLDEALAARGRLSQYPLPGDREVSWNDTQVLGTIALARFADDPALRAEATAAVRATADAYLSQRAGEAYAIPFGKSTWSWGSMGELSNRGLLLGTAYDLTGDVQYRDGALDLLDYILGRNPMGVSYVSGYGENAMRAPHHRHWAGAQYDGFPLPPPGAISGGPNSRTIDGPVTKAIAEFCTGPTCWVDHTDGYEVNEVCINWQAAFFWLTSWADDLDRA